MEILTGLIAFAAEISIRHVLVLNLMGWIVKCIFNHRGLHNWTDIIPVILSFAGVGLAYVDQSTYEANFIVHGLANAGMAWLLHKLMKETQQLTQKRKNGGTGDNKN